MSAVTVTITDREMCIDKAVHLLRRSSDLVERGTGDGPESREERAHLIGIAADIAQVAEAYVALGTMLGPRLTFKRIFPPS